MGILLYVVATIGALFISSLRKMWILGILVAFSFIISYIYYYMEFGSVWCFFSAIESCVLYYIVSDYMVFMAPSVVQKRATALTPKK